MPLPDERPRQSVANLIGRFEQQGKRQASPSLPVVPRSPSVSSQIAGDAAKDEVKDKREWPPKPVASSDIKPIAPTLSTSPYPRMPKSPIASPQPTLDPAPPADVPSTPTPSSPEPVMSPPTKGKPVAAGKATPTIGTWRASAPPAKPRSSITKSSASSPPRTSLQSSVSQPLRPQHTGQSVASNPSTIRQTRPLPRTAPSTPSRPKSSAAQNHAVSRPKTPSAGLFAPTAASLARSRNAPPPPPPPVKKVTLSSDAAERLSKPTAASLSKARTLVPTLSGPTRVVKSTSSGAHGLTLRGPSKLKVGRTPAKPREPSLKEGIESGPASVASEPSRDSGHLAAGHVENGHESRTITLSDVVSPGDQHGHSEVVSDVAHDHAADENVHFFERAGDHFPDGVHGHEHVAQNLPEEAVREHEEQVRLEVHDGILPEPAESHASEVIINGGLLQAELAVPRNELEDIVHLLEGTSLVRPRPQSIVSIPDEDAGMMDEY